MNFVDRRGRWKQMQREMTRKYNILIYNITYNVVRRTQLSVLRSSSRLAEFSKLPGNYSWWQPLPSSTEATLIKKKQLVTDDVHRDTCVQVLRHLLSSESGLVENPSSPTWGRRGRREEKRNCHLCPGNRPMCMAVTWSCPFFCLSKHNHFTTTRTLCFKVSYNVTSFSISFWVI